jgi:hypothetical protein
MTPSTPAAVPYEALIVGGAYGIGARISGAVARTFSPGVQRRLRMVLERGYCIHVISPDEATWLANRPLLMQQLGVAALLPSTEA